MALALSTVEFFKFEEARLELRKILRFCDVKHALSRLKMARACKMLEFCDMKHALSCMRLKWPGFARWHSMVRSHGLDTKASITSSAEPSQPL